MRVDRPLLLLLSALTVVGCADPEPFVDVGSTSRPTLAKPVDTVLTTGQVKVCYSDETPWAEVERLAAERCAAHGLQIYYSSVVRWQCRATSPHSAAFRCYDPEMLDANGLPINPFDSAAVTQWEMRTGKTAKPHNALTARALGLPAPAAETTPAAPATTTAPAPTTTMPPPPAPVQVAPLSPADIAGKPPIPPLPPRPQAPPPAAAAYPTDGFTLPQGSWGDHFQE